MTMEAIAARSLALALALALALGGPCLHAQGATEWMRLQPILSRIHGVATEPPKNLVTPKFTAGALMGNGDIGVVAGDTNVDGQKFYFGKSDFWGTHWNTGHNSPEVSILSLGTLTISAGNGASGDPAAYRVDEDILNAQVLTTLKLGGTSVQLRSWTADSANVFVTEISTPAGAADLPMKLALGTPTPLPNAHMVFPATSGFARDLIWVTRANDLSGASDYQVKVGIATRLVGATFTTAGASAEISKATFTVRAGHPVWLVTAFQSDARIGAAGPVPQALADAAGTVARKLNAASVKQLETAHRAWWKRYWLKSFVELHDPVLEDYYYGSLYVLGCASRAGHLPPSLWANWLTTDNAGWGGRYFMNYNEEAPFYGVASSNRPELEEPYNRMVLAQIAPQTNRTAAAGYQGVSFQRTFSPFTQYQPVPAAIPVADAKVWKKLPSDQKSNATFSLLPLVDYWEYTQDLNFLRTSLYPAMKGLDAFWRDFAVADSATGVLHFEHSSAHEGGDDVDPNLDLGFARRIATELIATSRVLNVDAAMRPVWQKFLDTLAPYPSGDVGGKPVYYIAASIKNTIKNQGLFEPGDQPIDLEGTVYPGENLAIGGDPTQLQIARNSMEQMNSWGVTRGGNTNNGFCKIFPIAARIGWPAEDLVAKLKAAILHQWRPSNLTVFQGGGGIETTGSIEAINSMLLQHEAGVMRLFPDWPRTMDAAFTHLRAKGAYLVSSEQKAGAVTFVDLTSEKGGSLTIQSPWGTQAVRVSCSSSKQMNLQPDASGKFTLATAAGGHYHLVLH
jgi:hypothetical protein